MSLSRKVIIFKSNIFLTLKKDADSLDLKKDADSLNLMISINFRKHFLSEFKTWDWLPYSLLVT